jgi:dipeptidyl aminopeptidase/acylaminoacyl peptidase
MKFTCIAAFAAAASVCVGLAAAQPPVEAFASLPFISEPQLSPDGAHFAALQSLDGKPAAVIYTVNAPAGTTPQVFASDNAPIVAVDWLKNDRLLMMVKSSRVVPLQGTSDIVTFTRPLSLAVGDGGYVDLFSDTPSMSRNLGSVDLVDKDLDDPNTVLMPLWTVIDSGRATNVPTAEVAGGNDFRFSLYRVDVHTGRALVAMNGPRAGAAWIGDGNGNIVARVEQWTDPLVDHVMINRGGSWVDVRQFDARADKGANVFGLTYDGKSLAYAAVVDGRNAMTRLDLDNGQTGANLFTDPHYDVAYALTDGWTDRVIGAAYADDAMKFVYFDPARAALQRGIEAVFPGKTAVAVSVTRDGKKAIVEVEAPQLPPTYYFLDRDTHAATKIASAYPGLSESDLGEMKPYPYKARDGLDIAAYLTLPPGKPAKNLPMVVLPHGGPDARDMIGFDWWAQFLANRGYVVFQPNYRGSKGYGHAFTDAGLGQWGLKMQDDITDGVKKLIADGTADPKRICIVGASYGGYAALAGATFTPDLYACAASISGVADLGRMLDFERKMHGRRSGSVSFWESRIGTGADDSRLDATSPALHADQVRVPVLLMHGRVDTTVPYAQGEAERDALERAGKKVEFVTFDKDDHYLTLAETRQQMLTNLERFLAANIGR